MPKKSQIEKIKENEKICKVIVFSEVDNNENVLVKKIKFVDTNYFDFKSSDQSIDNHPAFKNKIMRKIKKNKKTAEVDFNLDHELKKKYIKNNEFYFNKDKLLEILIKAEYEFNTDFKQIINYLNLLIEKLRNQTLNLKRDSINFKRNELRSLENDEKDESIFNCLNILIETMN